MSSRKNKPKKEGGKKAAELIRKYLWASDTISKEGFGRGSLKMFKQLPELGLPQGGVWREIIERGLS